jgi:type IV pilus assembly protein PilX
MVLLVAIIVLVALTLGALALTRSVYTSNVIAGNLAFQRAATHSAEAGVETAFAWLEANRNAPPADTKSCAATRLLHCDGAGYRATRGAPDDLASVSWLDYWNTTLKADAKAVLMQDDQLKEDLAGNSISYVIERMCTKTGDPTSTGNHCTVSPTPSAGTCSGGSSCSGGERNLDSPSPVYYRITVLVEGPRNTRSLVQAMVAL